MRRISNGICYHTKALGYNIEELTKYLLKTAFEDYFIPLILTCPAALDDKSIGLVPNGWEFYRKLYPNEEFHEFPSYTKISSIDIWDDITKYSDGLFNSCNADTYVISIVGNVFYNYKNKKDWVFRQKFIEWTSNKEVYVPLFKIYIARRCKNEQSYLKEVNFFSESDFFLKEGRLVKDPNGADLNLSEFVNRLTLFVDKYSDDISNLYVEPEKIPYRNPTEIERYKEAFQEVPHFSKVI